MTDNLIGDRYILGPLIGRGGMAEVRRARDTRLERDVAIKRLKADLAGDPIFQERFRREAHAAAGLNHPNIVSVYDTGEAFDAQSGIMIPYIVMELVTGHTLREILHDGRKIQPTKALELTQAVLAALDNSHRHGIIHRDIKPANVMLTNSGQVKVMDFGIARAVSDTAASMTQTASVIGTPQYLSPEQIRGEQVDRRSDLYATGCLLYELLTGRPPFEGDSPVSLAYQHVRATPTPPSEIDPMVSTQMDAIVLKALAKDPADRYQTAHEMSEDIGRLLAGQKVHAVVPAPVVDPETELMGAGGKTQVMPAGDSAKLASRAVEDAEEEPRSHLVKIIGIVLGVMLVLALGAVGLVMALNRDTPPPTGTETPGLVAVPEVSTMQRARAEETIQSKNLIPLVVEVRGPDDATVGQVSKQSPLPGEMVPVNSQVTIWVNIGPEKIPIPDVMKKPCGDAKAQLDLLFTNVKTQEATEEDPTSVIGSVVKVEPSVGTTVTKDTLITLSCATGQIKMPNVYMMPRDLALEKLIKAGFKASQVRYVYRDSTETPGSVLEQDPVPDAKVARDTQVTLYIAQAPAPPPETTTPPSETPGGGETTGG